MNSELKELQDYKEKIDQLINQIAHYKQQSDEMLALKQAKELQLEAIQKEYFSLTDKIKF